VLSDGSEHAGRIFLTRELRLKILDERSRRFREVPLEAIRRLDCEPRREWVEKEWRFRANASDEKVYTGRTYPARDYVHTITLRDGRTIRGPLSAIVYVDGQDGAVERFLLHQRDKGEPGTDLESLRYVRSIRLHGATSRSDEPQPEEPGRAGPPGR
jgi:hypothetical protein